ALKGSLVAMQETGATIQNSHYPDLLSKGAPLDYDVIGNPDRAQEQYDILTTAIETNRDLSRRVIAMIGDRNLPFVPEASDPLSGASQDGLLQTASLKRIMEDGRRQALDAHRGLQKILG